MTDAEKVKYQIQAKNDSQRYQDQLDMLDKHGYFIMSDGKKSTESKLPKKRKIKNDISIEKNKKLKTN